MLQALTRMGVEKQYIEILDHIYSNKSFFVRDAFGQSQTYKQNTGLAQGDSLSCILLNLLTTVIMHDAEETWSHDPQYDTLFEETFGFDHVLYADDTNLLSPTARSVRAMLHAVEEEAGRYGFQLNMDKTTLLRLGAARQIPPPLIRAKNGTQIRENKWIQRLDFR